MTPDAASITILGSYSGRNAGDVAILASIMRALCDELGPDVRFEVPTTDPDFIRRHYGDKFQVRPISVMPWTGSIRLLGIPTLRSIRRTDLTLITDGIIFDVGLWNPLFNFLITLVFLVPWARLCGSRVACYSVGIGPLERPAGRRFARGVAEGCALLSVREEDSLRLFREIGVEQPIHQTADAVFLDWGAEPERVDEIVAAHGLDADAEAERLLGFNVTRYVDDWLPAADKLSRREGLLPAVAEGLCRLRVEHGIVPVLITTQVMDETFGQRLRQLLAEAHRRETGESWAPALLTNSDYDNHELLGVMSRLELFTGMRLHSLILAARSGTPIVGLAYAPKVRSFLRQLGTPERSHELGELTASFVAERLLDAWNQRSSIRAAQQAVVSQLEEGAREAARLVRESCFPQLPSRREEPSAYPAPGAVARPRRRSA